MLKMNITLLPVRSELFTQSTNRRLSILRNVSHAASFSSWYPKFLLDCCKLLFTLNLCPPWVTFPVLGKLSSVSLAKEIWGRLGRIYKY